MAKRGPKRTEEERQEHVRIMEQSLIEGMSQAAVCDAASKKWGITTRQARYDIEEIHINWRDAADELRRQSGQELFAQAMLRREMLFNKALKTDQIGVALAVEKDRCELMSLYPDKAAKAGASTEDFSPDGMKRKLEEMLKGVNGSSDSGTGTQV